MKSLDCQWYDRGFCRHGPNCKNRHTRKVICQNYLCGFCLDGPRCTYSHPSFDIPNAHEHAPAQRKQVYVCDFCGETGHKAYACFKLPHEERQKFNNMPPNTMPNQMHNRGQMRHHHDGNQMQQNMMGNGNDDHHVMQHPPTQPFLPDVTCYKCNERGYVYL